MGKRFTYYFPYSAYYFYSKYSQFVLQNKKQGICIFVFIAIFQYCHIAVVYSLHVAIFCILLYTFWILFCRFTYVLLFTNILQWCCLAFELYCLVLFMKLVVGRLGELMLLSTWIWFKLFGRWRSWPTGEVHVWSNIWCLCLMSGSSSNVESRWTILIP